MAPPEPHTPPVTTVVGRDISDLLAPEGGRRQPLDGFDSDYLDIVDYIVRCTHRIWEEKRLDLDPDPLLRRLPAPHPGRRGPRRPGRPGQHGQDPGGVSRSLPLRGQRRLDRQRPGRLLLLAPDHQPHDQSRRERVGPPTGRRATVTTIADCVVRANRIVEEWLVRDNFSLVLQLGLDSHAIARDRASRRDQDLGRPPQHPWGPSPRAP